MTAIDEYLVRNHQTDLLPSVPFLPAERVVTVPIRPAGPDDAPERLLITWGVEPDNADAQRFYRRLGATLRTEVLAGGLR